MTGKIFIVDDNPDNLKVLEDILVSQGYSVRAATSGKIALNAIPLVKPELILLDIMMPGMDGFEVCRQLQKTPEIAAIPVLFISAISDLDEKLKAFAVGGLDYITKPFATQEVLARVRTHLTLFRMQQNLQSEVNKAVGEREMAYQKLQELNRSLEEKVDLAVNDLRQKDQLLIQQSRFAALGELLTNIAHQWRQPLNDIAITVQSMQLDYNEGRLTADEMHKCVIQVMNILKTLSKTIDDFRMLYTQSASSQHFAVDGVVGKTLEIIRPLIQQCGITLSVNYSKIASVSGSVNEFMQVLLNILNNSIDILMLRSIKDPMIDITVSTENGSVIISVSDNAGGIESDILPKIFDPYFTTKFAGKGTGLGLYMAKMIIETHLSGRIDPVSTTAGTCFRIILPQSDNTSLSS